MEIANNLLKFWLGQENPQNQPTLAYSCSQRLNNLTETIGADLGPLHIC